MTMADRLAAALKVYKGDNEWEDVIRAGTDWRVDESATDSADPSYRGDIVILTDGSAVTWDEQRGEWIARSPEWVEQNILDAALRRYLSGEDLYAIPETVSDVWEAYMAKRFPALAEALRKAVWRPFDGPGIWDPNTTSLTDAILEYLAEAGGDEQAAVALVQERYEESVRRDRSR